MVERRKQNLLCKLRLHKWKHYGESVVITWKEPPYLMPGGTEGFTKKSRTVFTKKKCLRCGTRIERIFVENPDGTLSCIGWKPLLQYEKDEEPQRMTGRKMIR